jgi:xanthine/uracil permease
VRGEVEELDVEGVHGMTEYLVSAVLFVAMITTLIYLWKREH